MFDDRFESFVIGGVGQLGTAKRRTAATASIDAVAKSAVALEDGFAGSEIGRRSGSLLRRGLRRGRTKCRGNVQNQVENWYYKRTHESSVVVRLKEDL